MTNFKNLANREDFASTREDFKDDTAKNKEDFSKIADRLEIKLMEFKSDILNFMLVLYIITMIAILGLYLNH
jgi:hypothetical protein